MATITKNLQPLVDKYQINPETNKLFNKVLELFNEQPNYQVWGVKAVFSKSMSINTLEKVADFIKNYSPLIKTLSKQNIVSYNMNSDEKLLLTEMEGVRIISFLKEECSKFNTAQKKMLFSELDLDNILPVKAGTNPVLKQMYNLFTKFEKLPSSRKNNFFSNASAYHSVDVIKAEMVNALSGKYEWIKEDCIAFIQNNCPDCEITLDEGPILIVKVPNYDHARKLCGGGRTQWCIANNDGERYFNQYVLQYGGRRHQFFFFDFSKKEYDELAHIGITIEDGKGIVEAYSCTDKNIHGGTIEYHGKKVNVLMALDMAKVEFGVFMKLKDMHYQWDHDSIMKLIEKNSSDLALSLDKGNIIVINCLSGKGETLLSDHTFINLGNIPVNDESKVYCILNLDAKHTSRNALVMSSFVKDSYGSYSESRTYNIFGVESKVSDWCSEFGIKVEDFLGKEKIPNEILLHKYIDNLLEEDACKLIDECRESGVGIDINFIFASRLPVFQAIGNKMYKLFKKIVEDPNFDCNKQDGFGETLLQSFLFQYCLCEEGSIAAEEKEMLENCIKSILSSDTFDFNACDINLDTSLNISCEFKTMNWITEALLAKPLVDVNKANYFNLTPVSTAAMYKNEEALKMLAERPDIRITQNDVDIAKEAGVNLENYFKKESFVAAEATAKY